jgi:hypothetical protein
MYLQYVLKQRYLRRLDQNRASPNWSNRVEDDTYIEEEDGEPSARGNSLIDTLIEE